MWPSLKAKLQNKILLSIKWAVTRNVEENFKETFKAEG